LSVRGKNKKEKIGSLFKRWSSTADEVLLAGQKDVDDFFEYERNYMVELHNHLVNCTQKADRMTRTHKSG
jgi:sorting nexin-5/6/32